MTKAMMASVALAALALAGCTSGGGGYGGTSAAPAAPAASNSSLIQYAPPPPAPAGSGTVVAGGSNGALCASKGGVVGEWGGEAPAKNCTLANGSSFPLAQLTAFPEFQ